MIPREPVSKPLIKGHRPVPGPEYWSYRCRVCDGWVEDHELWGRSEITTAVWTLAGAAAIIFAVGYVTAFLLR